MPMESAIRRVVWGALIALVLLIIILVNSASFITDLTWFHTLGYAPAFWVGIRWVWALRAAIFVVAFLIFWGNLRILRPLVARAMIRFQEVLPEGVTWRVIRLVFVLGSVVLAFLFSLGIGQYWQSIALFAHQAPFGQTDPVFGRDIGFYVFQLPVLNLIRNTLTGMVVLATIITGALYLLVGALQLDGLRVRLEPAARRHLAALAGVLFLLKAWGYWLAEYNLLYGSHGVVYGMSYVEAHINLPALKVLAVIALLSALAAFANLVVSRAGWVLAGVIGVVGVSVVFGGVVPQLVEQFIVQPNELELQSPYIARHVKSTLAAYNLESVDERSFGAPEALTKTTVTGNLTTLESVRLWDWRPLRTTYNQLQTFKRYYSFLDVDVDRYQIDGQLRQVELSARELSEEGLPNPSWVNLHLQYTHGYGVAASPVNRVTPEGLPEFFVSNIPPASNAPVLKVDTPQIYYGEAPDRYVIVNSSMSEFDYPSGDTNVRNHYAGTGGVSIGSLGYRLLFALRFGTVNILLNGNIDAGSKLMMYRNIADRVQRIAPFLRYDRDPYLVVANGKLFWMIDAYTTSNNYPYSRPAQGWGNYVRNAVKVVVDAYNGNVDYYVADPTDPLIRAYQGIYPGLFKPLSAMSPELAAHIRYPEDLFALQSRVYALYHMTDPTLFYNQEDLWNVPTEMINQSTTPVEPYYVVMKLPDAKSEEMVLMLPFTPANKDNMIAWLAARMDAPNYGKLVVYRFPKDSLTFGPAQIESRINQDSSISQLLTLWSQHGSSVLRGNLLVIPLDRSVLYVEPLYLRSDQSQLPELKRVIVAADGHISMGIDLQAALEGLFNGESLSFNEDKNAQPEPPSAADSSPAPPPEAVVPANQPALIAQAQKQYDDAETALRAGDFAAYGNYIKALGETLSKLQKGPGA